jgi:hypothetical protein
MRGRRGAGGGARGGGGWATFGEGGKGRRLLYDGGIDPVGSRASPSCYVGLIEFVLCWPDTLPCWADTMGWRRRPAQARGVSWAGISPKPVMLGRAHVGPNPRAIGLAISLWPNGLVTY